MPCSMEGNRMSGFALAMRHRLGGLSAYRLNGHSANVWEMVTLPLPLASCCTFYLYLLKLVFAGHSVCQSRSIHVKMVKSCTMSWALDCPPPQHFPMSICSSENSGLYLYQTGGIKFKSIDMSYWKCLVWPLCMHFVTI